MQTSWGSHTQTQSPEALPRLERHPRPLSPLGRAHSVPRVLVHTQLPQGPFRDCGRFGATQAGLEEGRASSAPSAMPRRAAFLFCQPSHSAGTC